MFKTWLTGHSRPSKAVWSSTRSLDEVEKVDEDQEIDPHLIQFICAFAVCIVFALDAMDVTDVNGQNDSQWLDWKKGVEMRYRHSPLCNSLWLHFKMMEERTGELRRGHGREEIEGMKRELDEWETDSPQESG